MLPWNFTGWDTSDLVLTWGRKKFETIISLKNHPWPKNCELNTILIYNGRLCFSSHFSLRLLPGIWLIELLVQVVFRRHLRPEKDHLSFSLIYNNGDRSLDLVSCHIYLFIYLFCCMVHWGKKLLSVVLVDHY